MRLNTAKSMKLARRVKGQFGTWQAVRQAARVENGVYIIERSAADGENPKERLQPVGA
jgi:hypothetical protein